MRQQQAVEPRKRGTTCLTPNRLPYVCSSAFRRSGCCADRLKAELHTRSDLTSGEQLFYNFPVDVGQAEVAALETEGQFFVIDAKAMKESGVEIVNV